MKTSTPTVVIANPKGGVGKSLLAILVLEWASHLGLRAHLVDADANQTVAKWVGWSRQNGRTLHLSEHPEDADITVIDTAGLPEQLVPHLVRADIILAPTRMTTADLARFAEWYQQLLSEHQGKVYVVPNCLRLPNPTRLNLEVWEQLTAFLRESGRAKNLLPGIAYREAIYGELYGGQKGSFFEQDPSGRLDRAQEEARRVLVRLSELLRLPQGVAA